MPYETGHAVGEGELERALEWVVGNAAGPEAGIFGPASIRWRIDRESVLFLGAGRALLLQLAHPWVAAGITEHSRTLADPIARFHGTFHAVYSLVFGALDQALSTARGLHRGHTRVQGRLPVGAGPYPEGSHYRANDIAALRWVFATLVETAVMAYDLVLPPLAPAERERYYAESRLFAACFGIPQSELPETWAAFHAYAEAMRQSPVLSVTPQAKELADRLLAGAGRCGLAPASYRALTGEMLAPHLREAFDLPAGPRERRGAERMLARLRWIYPKLPARLRYVGPYHEAVSRIAGRPHPDPVTRLSNRFWIGQASLASPPARSPGKP